jgi:hypothetical protein
MNKNQTPNRMRVVSSGHETAPVEFGKTSEKQTLSDTVADPFRSAMKLLPPALFLAASAGGGIATAMWLIR